jgi:hypothetical protein
MMMNKDRELGLASAAAAAASSTAGSGSLADGEALVGLAKLELSDLERKQARWTQARGTLSMRSISGWGPGVVGALIYIAGTWIANAYVDRSNTVTLYLAYVVSALTGVVFSLGWTVRILSRRLDAVVEIIEQQK